jgi:histidinol-phosphate/aromatic aminotransferase/cobyric acid decarboxylase-like protein
MELSSPREAASCAAVQKLPRTSRNTEVIITFYKKNPSLVPIPSPNNPNLIISLQVPSQ